MLPAIGCACGKPAHHTGMCSARWAVRKRNNGPTGRAHDRLGVAALSRRRWRAKERPLSRAETLVALESLDAERLARVSIPEPNSGCLLWLGPVNKKGYGLFSLRWRGKRRRVKAHRAIWIATRGPVPDGMMVCHRCDVRSCINPSHLFLGSARDNAQDMARKGRCGRGAGAGRQKITADVVRAIRSDSRPIKEIAAELPISAWQVWAIRERKAWRRVP